MRVVRAAGLATILLAVFLAGCTGAPPTGGIRGLVINDVFRPVPEVAVVIDGLGLAATTDASGQFEFAGLEEGSYSLRVSAFGLHGDAVNATVTPGSWTAVTLTVVRECGPGDGYPKSTVAVVAENLAFTPKESQVTAGDLPFSLRVGNEDAVPHKFHYEIVLRNASKATVLFEDDTVVAPGGNKVLHVPVGPWCGALVEVGGVAVRADEVEVLFEEPDFAAAGMTGRITFTA